MEHDEGAVLRLVGQLYEAVAEPEAWPAALSELCALTGSAGVVLHLHSTAEAGLAGRQVVHDMDPAFEESFRDYYYRVDPLFRAGVRAGPGVRPQAELLDLADFRRTEYYNDWWRPQRVEDSLAVVASISERHVSGATLARPRGAGDYETAQLRAAEHIYPHLRTALSLERSFAAARAREQQLGELLDRFDTAVLLLDGNGRVLRANRQAEAIARANDGIAVRHGAVAVADRRASADLARCTARVARTAAGDGLDAGGVVLVPRPSGRQPFVVQVGPLRPLATDGVPGAAAVSLLIRDPEAVPAGLEAALRSSFGLTRAQARTVALLVATGSVEDAAERLGVRTGTVRAHLKEAFAKTNTRGQVELVSLVLRSFA